MAKGFQAKVVRRAFGRFFGVEVDTIPNPSRNRRRQLLWVGLVEGQDNNPPVSSYKLLVINDTIVTGKGVVVGKERHRMQITF